MQLNRFILSASLCRAFTLQLLLLLSQGIRVLLVFLFCRQAHCSEKQLLPRKVYNLESHLLSFCSLNFLQSISLSQEKVQLFSVKHEIEECYKSIASPREKVNLPHCWG